MPPCPAAAHILYHQRDIYGNQTFRVNQEHISPEVLQ